MLRGIDYSRLTLKLVIIAIVVVILYFYMIALAVVVHTKTIKICTGDVCIEIRKDLL